MAKLCYTALKTNQTKGGIMPAKILSGFLFSGIIVSQLAAGATQGAIQCPATKTVEFKVTHETTYGTSVFVVGNIPALGSNDLRYAVKLEPSHYPEWRVKIDIPADAVFSYRFLERSDAAGQWGNSRNGAYISDLQTAGTENQNFLQQTRQNRQQNLWTVPDEPQRDYNISKPPFIDSVYLNERRPYRVFLPRGYKQSISKRYPVLYMHDGQNVFEVGPFGSWDAAQTITQLTKNHLMADVIVVAIDNTPNREKNYLAPDDRGEADKYARFLIEELKPLIDSKYRTLTDARNTGTLGSSYGGLVSMYLGWEHPDVFGQVGVMSGSFMVPNFTARIKSQPRPNIRVYLDSGDSGMATDGMKDTIDVRDNFLAKPNNAFVLNRDLMHVVGYGQAHNEAAWASRLPQALTFLFPPCQ